uniref:Uncharacterized protein n=1 Tax=Dendroctonus ponderosae TaxID=77166 RepID=A0AAR5QGE6_DENPD
MAEKGSNKRKTFGRSASTESTEYSLSMGRSVRKKKPKERWLLTRKTWKYMADAGRKLIPDGARNCVEDIPKIEAHFQELCRKEPKFLLWRKNSYPGAIGFRKKRKRASRKGGSCRKAISEAEVDFLKPERPKDLLLEPKNQGKFDLKKMREDFLSTPTPTDDNELSTIPSASSPPQQEIELVAMLEQYLKLADTPSASRTAAGDFNYEELVKRLQKHLSLASSRTSSPSGRSSGDTHLSPNVSPYSSHHSLHKPHVSFQGDSVQRTLTDTLSRYFGHYTNRDKVISDLLTDRKALEKLYFDLRKAKGFRGSRGGTGYSSSGFDSPSRRYDGYSGYSRDKKSDRFYSRHPPPLIEIEAETIEITYRDWGTQTYPVPEGVLAECEKEFRKKQAEEEEENREKEYGIRRRSSVDNDDVSQSVSDTIKRYLRMARKKSVDSEKAVGFKRVNYDRNLRNIKAKGEITKPGDDDGLTVTATAMQKSKSSSSVMQQGSMVAKKIFRSRSKSQTRPAQTPCTWTNRGSCVWNSLSGRQVILQDTDLLHLSELERKVLQKVAIAKLQALNLGVCVKVPTENIGAIPTKKRRPYLLKRKALTTGIFDSGRKDVEKDGNSSANLVFGIPLTQCVENDRLRGSGRSDLVSSMEERSNMARHGSRASFSSLIDSPRGDE